MTATQQLVVRFLNVGQGDATHIIFSNGEHMLIDTNLDAKNRGIDVIAYLADELPKGSSGKKKLDYLVITHPHTDHIRGVGQIGNQFEIGKMWHSGHELDCEEGENEPYDKYLAVIKDLGDDAVKVCAGSDVWATIGDATVHIFRPSAYVKNTRDQSASEKREAIHNECMVLKITYKGIAIMFAGDSHKRAWESIVKHYDTKDLKSFALHASHHGSRTFFKTKKVDDKAWTGHLDAIDPEYIVVSVGGDNEHDHPHDDMMKEYNARVTAANVYRNDSDLTVVLTIKSDGSTTWSHGDEEFQKKYELRSDEKDEGRSGG